MYTTWSILNFLFFILDNVADLSYNYLRKYFYAPKTYRSTAKKVTNLNVIDFTEESKDDLHNFPVTWNDRL